MQGLVLHGDITLTANDFCKAAINERLLLVSAGPKVIRMVPPLTINTREVRELIRRLEKTLLSQI